ncbi:T9SS type A sorting domain-containing protein [Rhodocytophaga rosea]|uniref:T9SS type A sorting domain-containing protein n=1 Tax=Rhodocytophaga rosea TaxID=2704465 RepID=A0A6C0GJM0_9BACT|nr:CUB domain-containing protein [Rhodocytophaga rosea]QHT68238.1 T9SS type A sorting domain-containing protein [Rhodocytophaga rosea]
MLQKHDSPQTNQLYNHLTHTYYMYLYLSTPKKINITPTKHLGKPAVYRTSATAFLIKVCLLTACIISLITDLIQAQGEKLWDRRFGGSNDDKIAKVIPTKDGGYLLAGNSYSGISGDKSETSRGRMDYWIVKIRAAGDKEWDRRFGGNLDDELRSVIQTSDGGFLLVGNSYSGTGGDKTEASRGGQDGWVIKISSGGIKQWDKRFGGTGNDGLRAVVQTADGGYLLGGYSNSDTGGDKSEASRGGSDYWIIKITSTGAKQWDRRFGGSAGDFLGAMIMTTDGNYMLAGSSNSGVSGEKTEPSWGGKDYWMIKINTSGHKLWDKRFGSLDNDGCSSLLATDDGGYLLGGHYDEIYEGKQWIVKTDGSGILQWEIYPGFGFHQDLIKDSDGGYLILSTMDDTYSPDANYQIYAELKKIDKNGKTQWVSFYKGGIGGYELGGVHKTYLVSAFQTSDGSIVMGGFTDLGVEGDISQPSKGMNDFWVVKTIRKIKPGEIVMRSGSIGVSSGNIYYDPGFLVNYQDNLNVTQTLSARAGYKLRLTFTSFQLENIYDKLYIYNGTSTSAPLIGVYTGSNSPGIITSSGGSLTFRFTSDAIATSPGWVANISYVPVGARLAAEETAVEDTQETLLKLEAFPNPFRERITFNFTVQQTGPVNLKIYDSKGIEAADVFAGEMQAGETKSLEWQPNGQQEGVYIIRLGTPGRVITNKIVLIR